VKLILVYPMTTGRNFDEVLRVIDSLQLTAEHKVSTPVNWQQGDDVIIAGSVSDEQARELFGTWNAPRPYIRVVPQPGLFRVDNDQGPFTQALRLPVPSPAAAPRARDERAAAGLQMLVDRFKTASGGRTVTGPLPVHVAFPVFGL